MVCPVADGLIESRGTEQSDLVVGLDGFLVGKGRIRSLHQSDLGYQQFKTIQQIEDLSNFA
jgi:hypothetical protein